MAVQVGYLEELVVPARFDRGLIADLFNAGVRKDADLKVTNGGGKVSNIAVGVAYIKGNLNADQGTYRLWLDAAGTVIHDAAAANPRVDQVIAYVRDSNELGSGALDDGVIAIAKGTEAAGAQVVDPNATGYRAGAVLDAALPKNAIRLFDVLVPVGAGAIPGGNYVDRRTFARGYNVRKTTGFHNRQAQTYAEVDASLTQQFEANGTSLYRLTYMGGTKLSIGGGRAGFRMWDNFTDDIPGGQAWEERIDTAAQPYPVHYEVVYTPAAGLHSLVLHYACLDNAGFVNADFSVFHIEELAQPVTG